MAAIRTLLNPSTNDDKDVEKKPPPSLLSPLRPTFARATSPSPSPRKKQKVCKDQPVFTRGPVRGPVRYPPHEYEDKELSAYHQQFDMFPVEDLAAFPRHIPYNSEKKLFQGRTGRDFFEVFQYQFKVPGCDQTYTLLWDYNIGLVRTTPLFKCCGYGKTTPSKMLNRNVGLRDICHSITGGALVAQGYWIPYEAAKAVAATFCWSIRYALTPAFGIDFIDMCIPPDSDKFGQMLIDPKITRLCTEQAREYQQLELENPTSRPASALPSPCTPCTPIVPRVLQPLRFKAINDTSSSGYTSEASNNDRYTLSPTSPVPFRYPWSAAKTPRSTPRIEEEILSPKTLVANLKVKRAADHAFGAELGSTTLTPAVSPKLRRFDHRLDIDEDYDGDNSEIDFEPPSLRHHAGKEALSEFREADAAKVLLSMWGVRKVPERRASA